jgi:hypothetical protein
MAAIESAGELLARASSRTEVWPGDGKAGARYERVLVDEEPYFVKHLTPSSDWIMRVTGDHAHRPYLAWQSGIMARSPGCIDHADLCWYLALSRARLPEPKEAAIERFRAALEAGGVATGSWWDDQLDLCLIGIMATFGWEKALGDAAELSWWENAVAGAAARQGIPAPGTSG